MYIPEDKEEFYAKAEEIARNHDISLASLIMMALERHISDLKNPPGAIQLTLMNITADGKLTYRRIGFDGRQILETKDAPICDNEWASSICRTLRDLSTSKCENQACVRAYRFFESKGKILVFMTVRLVSYKSFSEEVGITDFSCYTDEDIERETNDYRVFADIGDLLRVITDLSPIDINTLIKETVPVEPVQELL